MYIKFHSLTFKYSLLPGSGIPQLSLQLFYALTQNESMSVTGVASSVPKVARVVKENNLVMVIFEIKRRRRKNKQTNDQRFIHPS